MPGECVQLHQSAVLTVTDAHSWTLMNECAYTLATPARATEEKGLKVWTTLGEDAGDTTYA
jgi:hypothetical protein